MRTACRGSKSPRFGCHPDVNRNTSEASLGPPSSRTTVSGQPQRRSAIRASPLRDPRSVRPTAAVRCAKVRPASRPAGHSESGWSDNVSADVERTPDSTSSSENLTQTFRTQRPRKPRRRPDGRWPGCRPQSVPAPQGTDTNGSAPETVADTCGRMPPARPPRRAVTPKTAEVDTQSNLCSTACWLPRVPGTLRSWIQPTQDGKSSGPFTTRSLQTATPPPFVSSPRL
jgi:hypothetical protein